MKSLSSRAWAIPPVLGACANPAPAPSGEGSVDHAAPEYPEAVTHRLESGPGTVAWGFYWAQSEPGLRVESGDIIDVNTMLTSSPRLEAAGIPADQKVGVHVVIPHAAFP